MLWQDFDAWLNQASLHWVAAELFVVLCVSSLVGVVLRRVLPKASRGEKDSGQEGYMVSAVLGLLALLLGFTFSMAVERFDARRLLVLEEANAIGTAYLRAQLLPEPHRARASDLLVRYTDNRLVLAKALPGTQVQMDALKTDDALVTDMWAATSAAFDSIKTLDFSSTYVSSINTVIDLDASRRAARMARVPSEVFAVLLVFLVTTAGVLGSVLNGLRGRLAAGLLLALLTLSLILIIDINRPVLGGVFESQRPMEDLRKSLTSQPRVVFDKWRT